MSTFTLDDIKAAAERKHGSTTIPLPDRTLVLRNSLSLDDDEYVELTSVQEKFDEASDSETPITAMRDLVVRTLELWAGGTVDDLVDALGGDLAQLTELMTVHAAGTQMGEATSSAS